MTRRQCATEARSGRAVGSFRQENELPPRNAIYAMLDATMRGASSGVALARSLAAISGNSAR
jgi:hypothetical protein